MCHAVPDTDTGIKWNWHYIKSAEALGSIPIRTLDADRWRNDDDNDDDDDDDDDDDKQQQTTTTTTTNNNNN